MPRFGRPPVKPSSAVRAVLGVATVVLSPSDQGPRIIAAVPADPTLKPIDLAAAEWALARGELSGRGTATLDAADWEFHPLKTPSGVLAVLGVDLALSGGPLPPDRQVLFATLLGQAALTLESRSERIWLRTFPESHPLSNTSR